MQIAKTFAIAALIGAGAAAFTSSAMAQDSPARDAAIHKCINEAQARFPNVGEETTMRAARTSIGRAWRPRASGRKSAGFDTPRARTRLVNWDAPSLPHFSREARSVVELCVTGARFNCEPARVGNRDDIAYRVRPFRGTPRRLQGGPDAETGHLCRPDAHIAGDGSGEWRSLVLAFTWSVWRRLCLPLGARLRAGRDH